MDASPGDYDPSVPLTFVSTKNWLLTNRANTITDEQKGILKAQVVAWTAQAERMAPGETTPWWEIAPSVADDKMSYECDAKLGSPSEVDCAQVQWHQLDPSSADTLTVGANQVSFYHSSELIRILSFRVD